MQIIYLEFPEHLKDAHSITIDNIEYKNKNNTKTDNLVSFTILQKINK
jgi:hypothetical protein